MQERGCACLPCVHHNTSSNSVHIYLYIAFGLHARRCRCWIPGLFGPFDFITSTYCVSTHVCVPGADFYNNDDSMRPMRVCFPKHLGINQRCRLNSLTSIGKLRGKRAVKGDKKRRMEKTKQKGNRETESKMEDGKYKSPKIQAKTRKRQKEKKNHDSGRWAAVTHERQNKKRERESKASLCLAIRRFSSSSYSGCWMDESCDGDSFGGKI